MAVLTTFGKYSQYTADIGYLATGVMADAAGPAVMTGTPGGQP